MKSSTECESLNGRTARSLMAKATSKKTAASKKTTPKKAAKKITKTTPKKGSSNAGRKQFDGKDVKKICAKLKEAYLAGANDTQASILAGISRDSLIRYMKANPEFRTKCDELAEVPKLHAHVVNNSLIAQREKKDNVYDEDGNKIDFVPTRDAIVAARRTLAALDQRYSTRAGELPPPPPANGGLTEERKAEIAEALFNRKQPDPEAYEVKN